MLSDVPVAVAVVVFLNSILSSKKLKKWTNVSRDSLPKFAKVMAPTKSHTATPACQTIVHHFHGCLAAVNYGAGVGVFSTKHKLNTGGSLPVSYLNSWFRFTAAETAKPQFKKCLSLNYFVEYLVHKKTVNFFFLSFTLKDCYNVDDCVCFF